jgi:hypothetical protein
MDTKNFTNNGLKVRHKFQGDPYQRPLLPVISIRVYSCAFAVELVVVSGLSVGWSRRQWAQVLLPVIPFA